MSRKQHTCRRPHHCDQVDVEATLAELLLKTRIGVVRRDLGQDLNGLLEVTNVTFVAGSLEQLPSFVLGHLSNMGIVDDLGVLAFDRSVACVL